MKNSLLKFLVSTLVFTLLLAGIAFTLSKVIPADIIHQQFYFILLYFFFITSVFHYGLVVSLKGRPQQFIRYFMGATTFKLLIHITVVIIFSLLNRPEAVDFILSFFAVYILFTAYEMRIALKLSRTTVS